MTGLIPGDPASVSSLAGEIARQSEALRERLDTLTRVEAQLADWDGLAAEGFRIAFASQLHALDDSAGALAACGHALQAYVVDLQQAQARAAEAEEFCHRHRLRLEPGGTVVLPWGSYSVEEAASYHDRIPEAQRLVRRAVEEAEDASVRLARRVDEPVQTLTLAGQRALAAVTTATSASQAPPQ
ncbi:MAG TPA: hypothetical protein VFD41_07085 [Actinomycetales bacterium]|nr:hypothetical protein [Actinomycetales bacterium]